jgi:hypothetical protein
LFCRVRGGRKPVENYGQLQEIGVMGCTRGRNTNEVVRVSGRSGRGNWLSSTLVKLRYDQ